MRNQRTFRRAGGTARVDQDCRIIGLCPQRAEGRTVRGGGSFIIHITFGAVHAEHFSQGRAGIAHGLDAGAAALIANGDHGLAVLQAKGQRIRPEQHRQRHSDRPHLKHRHISRSGLKALRHHDGDAVAALHAKAGKHMTEGVRSLLKLQISMKSTSSLGLVDTYSYTFGSILLIYFCPGPAAAANVGNVEVLIDLPAKGAMKASIVVLPHTDLASHRRLVTILISLQMTLSL